MQGKIAMTDVEMIIFDIDGTLLNSVEFNTVNLNRALNVLGFDHRVSNVGVKQSLGCTAEDFYHQVLEGEAVKYWQAIRQEARAHMEEIMASYGKAFDGVKDTVQKLHEKGITIVLYSNCSRRYMDAAIKCIGIEPFLSYTECVKENGLDKIALIAKIRTLFPDLNTVVVGDRIHDIEAAHANGVRCIGARYGYGDEELQTADDWIDQINALIE